ncbi:MAG: outer membrane beta-barrel protein [Bryobacterales bacterium]|nr:outer membrane beta-barrel protein [Bryobacterales bacterium]
MVNRNSISTAFLLAILSLPLAAQLRPVEFGFKAGVPLNDLVRVNEATGGTDDTLRFTGGGLLQLNLPLGFAVEANALYKRPGFDLGTSGERVSQWEFPILAKVYPLGRNPLIQPYGAAGISFRRTFNSFNRAGGNEVDRGFVVSAGVRNGPGRVKISPEFRYTRWASGTLLGTGLGGSFAEIDKNQLEFLVGISF